MTTKTYDETCQKWIEFWTKKGSLFIQNKDTVISPEIILRSAKIPDQDKLNLFFTINGFKNGSKSRKTKNISKLNAFVFDIDLKWKNEGISKKEAYALIEPYADYFDFIVESGWWYHLYILVDGKYDISDLDTFLSDWQQKWTELEAMIWLEFDKACFLPTQILRVAWSLHQKDISKTPTPVKLVKGMDLLFPAYERRKAIDSIPISQVLEALNIDYKDDRIIEYGRLTNGRRINLAENYVNDFSGKGRPVGWPFSLVKHWHMRHFILDEQNAVIKTYRFFSEKFGIIRNKLKQKTVAIPEVIENWLANSGLDWKEIQAILSLVSYSRTYYEKQLPYGLKITAYVSDILRDVGLSDNAANYVKTLKRLEGKINYLFVKTPILNIKTEKVSNIRRVEFSILPEWYHDKKIRWRFYLTHYVKKKLFEIGTKSEDLRFYLKLSNEFISKKDDFVYEVLKNEICSYFGDENFARIKKKIEKIQFITQDFSMTTTGSFVQFKKA